MIGSSQRLLFLPALLLAAAAIPVTGSSASALAVATVYANPNGVGSGTCSAAAPCTLTAALATAASGATVIVESGNYYKDFPLASELDDNGKVLTITGPATGKPPVIYSAADSSGADGMFLESSSLSRVTMVYSGGNTAILAFAGPVSHVTVLATNGDACAVFGPKGLSDSLCVTTASNGASAVAVSAGSSGSQRTPHKQLLRNVTAIGAGPGDFGVTVGAGDSYDMEMSMINVIAKGVGADVQTNQDDNVSTRPGDLPPVVKVTASHCDFKTELADYNGTTILPKLTIKKDRTDISAAPKFTKPAILDYSEKAGSPTINKGAKVKDGTDLIGTRRTLGSAPDIGAFEFRQRPAVSGLKVTSTEGKAFTGKVTVNGEGFGASLQIVVTHNGHHVATLKPKGAATHKRTFHFTVHGLKPAHQYTMRAVAHNKVGTTKSPKVSTHTNG